MKRFILIFGMMVCISGFISCRNTSENDTKKQKDGILERTRKKMDSNATKKLDKQIEEMGKDSIKIKHRVK